MRKFKKIKISKNLLLIDLGLLFGFFISSILFIFNIIKYSGISQSLFGLAIIILILLNILGALLILSAHYHKALEKVEVVYLSILLILTLVGNYYLIRISSSIGSAIIDTSKTQTEEIETSFVTYDNNSIKDIEDINNKKFGIIDNESFLEGHQLALSELENKEVTVTFVKYETYNDMLLGLFAKEIDVAALPSGYYAMFIINDGYEEYLDKTTAVYSFISKVETEGIEQVEKDLTTEPFTILLMGNDDERTDTLILATFNPQTFTATMTSIGRDSYVPIACYKNEASDKINHSRVVSRQCTIDTVSNLLNVDIDYFVEVNFQAVVDIVDAVDGLWLYSPVEFVGQDASSDRGNFTVWVGEGWQTMDGLQALALSRERHAMPNGDLDRQLNQQKVISALITKLMETKDINQLISVIDAAGSNVRTNIPLSKMTTLANYLIEEMDNNTLKTASILQIKSSRLAGYFSWAYNEPMQLPLSIYKLYNGSIADAQDFINDNLMLNYQTNNQTKFTFNIEYPYYGPNFIKDSYDEVEIHEPLPDFMPSMTGSKVWTLADVNTWAANRTWINLSINEIWPDDAGYNKNYLYNQVVSQSIKYGVKTSNISSLSLSIIKHELDCSILANQTDAQCKNVVPDFTGWKLLDVTNWSQLHNFPVTIVPILETDPKYDKTKVGLISSQLEKAYSKIEKLTVKNLTVYTMDYPSVTLPVSQIKTTQVWTKTQVETWYLTNMYVKPVFVYATTNSATEKDKVVDILVNNQSLNQDTLIRTDATITYVLSIGPAINRAPIANTPTPFVIQASLGAYTGNLTGSDPDANQITFIKVTDTTNGVVVVNTNGSFTYTANTGYTGPDSFTFKVNDGLLDSVVVTVNLTVN